MKFRWPLRSYECDECGHVTRGLQKPWYRSRPVAPQQEFVATLWNTQTQMAVNASTGFAATIKRNFEPVRAIPTGRVTYYFPPEDI